MKFRNISILILLSILVISCRSMDVSRKVAIPVNTQKTSSIGSTLFTVKKTKPLKNAFGKADIFGRSVNAGYSELRFMGLDSDKQIIFRITDTNIESNETTMSRSGINTTTIKTDTKYTSVGSTSNTTINEYKRPSAPVTQLPPSTIEFLFDPSAKTLVLEGVKILVLSVTTYSITYILQDE